MPKNDQAESIILDSEREYWVAAPNGAPIKLFPSEMTWCQQTALKQAIFWTTREEELSSYEVA